MVALLGIALLVGVSTRSAFDREREQARDELRDAAQTLADGFSQDLALRTIEGAADDVAMASGDPQQCVATLSAFSGATASAHVHVLRADGSEVCSLRASDLPKTPIATDGWFQQALTEDRLVTTPPAIDPLSGLPAYVAALPLHGANGSRGVLAVVVYTGVPDLQRPSGLSDALWLVMLDEARTLVIARSENAPYRLGQPVAGTPLAVRVPPGGTTRTGPGRQSLMLGESRALTFDWPIIAGVPTRVAMAPARAQLWRSLALGGLLAALILALGVLLHRRLVRPVRQLHAAIEASRSGTDVRAPVEGPVEVAKVATAYNALIAEREELEDHLRHRATHDPLTGLPNRRALTQLIDEALQEAAPGCPSPAVLYIDLDRFKLVNDSHGHAVGDRLLIALAARLVESLPACSVGRFGGDEFVILAQDVPGESEAKALAESVAVVLRQPFAIDGQELWLSGSVGIALPGRAETAEDLISNADTAMYRAKEAGPDRSALFDSAMRAWSVGRLNTERDLHRALDADQFELHYQPLVSLSTGQILRLEALLRWRHPERGLLLPGEFISVSEQTHLIVPIGRWVFEEACRQVVAWRERSTLSVPVDVNLAAHQLSRADLPQMVADILGETGALPEQIGVEITESAVLADVATSGATLGALHDQGIRVAVDDFGTGYSSLAYLQRLPVDELKVDRSFVEPIGRDARTGAIVSSLVSLAHAIGLEVVAEGVEHGAQLRALVDMNCDLAQGFYLARPAPPPDIADLLRAGIDADRALFDEGPARRT
ncbi:MAG: EAL domain-containing protein [Actinomycetota bacterium]|nr:EAL domain-containing protein [Actinomycetota bacterium]